mmetsp:Transcript_3265/g.5920  ORF Transcript_3265/g.5920 Transcript_3265/m.5920 type:complete len:603 (+) Transcript_3265:84-1892(+)
MHKFLITVMLTCLVPSRSGQLARDQQPWTAAADSAGSGAHGARNSQRNLALLLHALGTTHAFNPSGPTLGSTRDRMNLPRHAPILATTATTAQPAQASLDSDVPRLATSPGEAEKQRFQCDPSCEEWKGVRWDNSILVNLQTAAEIVAKYMPKPFERPDAQAVEFWGKHAARLSYFMTNAVAGLAAYGIFGKYKDGLMDDFDDGLFGQLTKSLSGLILDAIKTYEQDWLNIKAGKYAMPWDMAAGHRQTTLPYALRQSARFVEEAVGTMERRSRAAPEDRKIWMESGGGMYPEYYQTNYHYQTDGWMSAKSAAVYETSTETLFLGKQDAMQRASLLPLRDLKGVDGRPAKILEVACGTGRFATFIRDNHPDAEVTCVDLSPFYLEAARENDEYWRNFKSRGRPGISYAPAQFVQAAAEALPFETESFDAVVCVYLFHEMPEGARAAAAAEMARVVRPGGTVVLTDSLQHGDRPLLSNNVDKFAKLNEPHVSNYFTTHLADIFEPNGLVCGHKYVTSVSKTLSFTKPADLDKPTPPNDESPVDVDEPTPPNDELPVDIEKPTPPKAESTNTLAFKVKKKSQKKAPKKSKISRKVAKKTETLID